MEDNSRATIESQIEGQPCNVEDTEEMFWLRESDDYQSQVDLAMKLVAQYRYKDAVAAFKRAEKIKSDDLMLYLRLGGTCLSVLKYDEAKRAYDKAVELGAKPQMVVYPLGIWHYLQGQYKEAAEYFVKCLPCGGEMKIAAIYWNMLASARAGIPAELLKEYTMDMEVGHHTMYKLAVDVMTGNVTYESAMSQIDKSNDDLFNVVAMYGIWAWVKLHEKDFTEAEINDNTLERLLNLQTVWPCVSYLAGYVDRKRK